jgi:molybdopterin molybdotransferase
MGEQATIQVNGQEAVKVATGAMIPEGADAVVMVEDTERTDETIEVNTAVSPGQHIVLKGDDLKKGKTILTKGHQIRPQDIGALAALGITTIEVQQKIKITLFSTGDELIDPGEPLTIGKIRDINSYTVGALGTAIDAEIFYGGIIPDEQQRLTTKIQERLPQSDLILLSGGSSVGTKDMTLDVINALGEPGVLVHGIAIKPGKPTILSVVNNTGIIGLPGHPVSAMMVFQKVVEPIIKQMMGLPIEDFRKDQTINARLVKNVASTRGREEYLRVKLFQEKDEVLAEPILGSSSLISTLVAADGLIKVPLGTEGIAKDTIVAVELFG